MTKLMMRDLLSGVVMFLALYASVLSTIKFIRDRREDKR